ncbi:hypothetical protein CcCBS67573_g07663 [Chytriomyces confervae]|uniref:Uncharacterized protein n=1 Tax=Chytriomyces confervae TaxID=246404 RepID=A0A507EUP7_9FUNG|nr:hypothetical protein CcCBS67573_g07663 [Chytriomyces confervae]
MSSSRRFTVLFVQCQRNQPVKMKSHFDGQGMTREDPLSDVADLIEAFFLGVSPADLGQYTLRAVADGVVGPTLEPDLPLSTLSTGFTANTALIIKSNSYMDFDDSGRTSQLDSIEIVQINLAA